MNTTTKIARIYVRDETLLDLITTHCKKTDKTSEVTKTLKGLGFSASPSRVNRLMGRYAKKAGVGKITALTDNKKVLLNAVKAHAIEHYEEGGWDYVVETFNDQDILDVIDNSWTVPGAIARVAKHAKAIADQHQEVMAGAY
jgi:hypothetical protein